MLTQILLQEESDIGIKEINKEDLELALQEINGKLLLAYHFMHVMAQS